MNKEMFRSAILFHCLFLHALWTQETGDLRLYSGSATNLGATGVLQIFENGSWQRLCSNNFNDTHAVIACKELGYQYGYVLPDAAFGEIVLGSSDLYKGRIISCPAGASVRFADCEFDSAHCPQIEYRYVSVSCRNNTNEPLNATGRLLLDTSRRFPESGYLSPLYTYGYEIWGLLCSELWNDVNADVACRELGFAGGVAASFDNDANNIPYLLSVECAGTETRLKDCQQMEIFCSTRKLAGVFCYQNESPTLFLTDVNYGQLILSVDGQHGHICNSNGAFQNNEAIVACKQMGFRGGYVIPDQYGVVIESDWTLENVSCETGLETSLFDCDHNGWKVISQGCSAGEQAVSVYCYRDVHLFGGPTEPSAVLMGRVLVYKDDQWLSFCPTVFSQPAADIVCGQLGFSSAEIMLPGSFGSSGTRSSYIRGWDCHETIQDMAKCDLTIGDCSPYRYDAAVLCMNESTADVSEVSFALSDNYYGEVEMTRHGVTGHVCREGWDDLDAEVICKQAGFQTGIALGTFTQFARYQPVWGSKFACTGTETSLSDCAYNTSLATDWGCAEDLSPAGALCFTNPITSLTSLVRLRDGKSDAEGRVEVFNDQTGWGTVCNSGWGNQDAAVFCRQLGFADGQTQWGGFTTKANDLPVVLSGIRCTGTESSIFECRNDGWLRVSSLCSTHDRDAGVYCYKHVRLYPRTQYGAVQYHSGESYGLTCADTFDANAAKVVCRQFGFGYSQPLCCSAMGPSDLPFTLSDVSCTGNEANLRECSSNSDNPSCTSGTYASVYCAHFQLGFQSMRADPILKIHYFLQEGYVCTEEFTNTDAGVVCTENGFLYGKAVRASAVGLESQLRWLRGLNCQGTENRIRDCGPHTWGQIGVCSWDSVAAVLCSDKSEDLTFDIRLTNGTDTAGRVEVKVKGNWTSLCGTDLTQKEARVICRELGYHEGRVMTPGYYGAGTKSQFVTDIRCDGSESGFADCVWSGPNLTNSAMCEPSEDAAVTCFYNVRLAGSVTPNYGRLEMYDSTEGEWLAVCDRNFNTNHARTICRQLGYVDGLVQNGSPLGPTTTKLSIVEVTCDGGLECTFSTGNCGSGRYLAMYCTEMAITNEYLDVRLPLSSFYGPVSVRRFGLWGHVCSAEFDDADAEVVCRQLGFESGSAVQTYQMPGYPIIQGQVKCRGTENELADCDRGLFQDRLWCYGVNTVAGVICYNSPGLSFGSAPLNHGTGMMSTHVTVQAGDQTLYIAATQFTDIAAAVYCEHLGYAGGEVYRPGPGAYGVMDLVCSGSEQSILACQGTWDPEKTRDKTSDLAGATCFTSVRLVGGDPLFYGAVFTSKGVRNGPVCAENFDEVDAEVACQSLNYDAGLVLCCTPFGVLDVEPVITNVQCNGSEGQFTDCNHDSVDQGQTEECKKNYAAVACFSGSKPTEYQLSLPTENAYTGHLTLTYLGIEGSVCMDGWNDRDAHVACKELGFQRGLAYTAARSTHGPYWTSNVQCQGTEQKLADCQHTDFGKVTECDNVQSHAGLICFDNEGMYYRLTGTGESRYGRVEVSLNGEWRAICNTHWDNMDASVLCKMLEYRTGEAYHGEYNETLGGPVWDVNFMCEGGEGTLNECLSSGWHVSTSAACAGHSNDAGVFCYKSVKLSTGVGRNTDKGAVLFYKDETWYKVCADNFTDSTAAAVCKELGFTDGQSQCCDLYGDLLQYPLLGTHKLECSGDEEDMTKCLVDKPCNDNRYASVVCYGFKLATKNSEQSASPQENDGIDPIPIVIAVIVFAVLTVVTAGVVYCLQRYRKHKKDEASKQTFDTSIMAENVDGSFAATNRLSGLVNTPELPRVRYERKGESEAASISHGYQNPNYQNAANSREDVPGSSTETGNSNGAHTYNTMINVHNSDVSRTYHNVKDYESVTRSSQLNTGDENPYSSLYTRDSRTVNQGSAGDYDNPDSMLEDSYVDGGPAGDNRPCDLGIRVNINEDNIRTSLSEQKDVPSPTDSVHESKLTS